MVMAAKKGLRGKVHTPIIVKGGNLNVDFQYDGKNYNQVFLEGPATYVFQGSIPI